MTVPREQRRKIQRMDGERLFRYLANLAQQAFDAGYAQGLTADLDSEAVVLDVEEAGRRIGEQELLRLIGGAD